MPFVSGSCVFPLSFWPWQNGSPPTPQEIIFESALKSGSLSSFFGGVGGVGFYESRNKGEKIKTRILPAQLHVYFETPPITIFVKNILKNFGIEQDDSATAADRVAFPPVRLSSKEFWRPCQGEVCKKTTLVWYPRKKRSFPGIREEKSPKREGFTPVPQMFRFHQRKKNRSFIKTAAPLHLG